MQDVWGSTTMKALISVCLIGLVLSFSLGDEPKYMGEEEKNVAQNEQGSKENDVGDENQGLDHSKSYDGMVDNKEETTDEEYLEPQGGQDQQDEHNHVESEEEEGYYGYKEYYTEKEKTASDDDDRYDDDGYDDLYDAYYDDNEALNKEGYYDKSYKEYHTDNHQQWVKHSGQQEEKNHNEKESDHSSKKETLPEGYGDDSYDGDAYYDDHESQNDESYHDERYKERHTDQQQWDKHGGQWEEQDRNEKETEHSSKKETHPEYYGYHNDDYSDKRYSNYDDEDDVDDANGYGYHDSVYDGDSYGDNSYYDKGDDYDENSFGDYDHGKEMNVLQNNAQKKKSIKDNQDAKHDDEDESEIENEDQDAEPSTNEQDREDKTEQEPEWKKKEAEMKKDAERKKEIERQKEEAVQKRKEAEMKREAERKKEAEKKKEADREQQQSDQNENISGVSQSGNQDQGDRTDGTNDNRGTTTNDDPVSQHEHDQQDEQQDYKEMKVQDDDTYGREQEHYINNQEKKKTDQDDEQRKGNYNTERNDAQPKEKTPPQNHYDVDEEEKMNNNEIKSHQKSSKGDQNEGHDGEDETEQDENPLTDEEREADKEKETDMQKDAENEKWEEEMQRETESKMKDEEMQRKEEIQRENEKKKEEEKQREAQMQREKEKKKKEEMQKEAQMQRENEKKKKEEMQREAQMQRENEKKKEEEKQREAQMQRENEKKKEEEKQREAQMQRENEKKKEEEKQREAQMQRENEKKKEEEKQREAQMQRENEKKKEEEKQKEAQMQRENEKKKKEEMQKEAQMQSENEKKKEEEKQREAQMQRENEKKKKDEEMQRKAEGKKEADDKVETGGEKRQMGENEETNIGGSQSGSQNHGGSTGQTENGDDEGPANQRDKMKSNTDNSNENPNQQNTDGDMQNNRDSNLRHNTNTNQQHNTNFNNHGNSSPNSDDDTNHHGKRDFSNQENRNSNSHHNTNNQDNTDSSNQDSRGSNSQGKSNLNSLDNKNSKANSNNNARDNTNFKNKQNANLQSDSNTNAQANRNVNTQENRNANAQTDQNDNIQNNGNANAQTDKNANAQNNRNVNTQDDRNANAHTNGNANSQENRNGNALTNRNVNTQDERNANAQSNQNVNTQENRNANAQTNQNGNTQENRNGNALTNRNDNAQNNRNVNIPNNRNTNLGGTASKQQKKTSKEPQPPASSKISGKLIPSKKKDFDRSFGSDSVSSFDGQKFDSNGGLTDSFKRTLKPSTQEILNKFDQLFPNVIDYRGTFRTLRTENLIGFISRFTNQFYENREVFDTFFISPADLRPDDVKKIPLEFLASLKTSVLTEKMSQIDIETKNRVCMSLGNNDISSTSTRKLLQVVDCSNWLSRTSMCRNPISNVLAKDFEEQHKTTKTLTDIECLTAAQGHYFCALSKKTIRKCSVQFLYSNLHKLGNDSTAMQYVFKLVFSSDEHTVARLMPSREHMLTMTGKLKYLKAAYLKKINKNLIISALDLFALESASMDTAAKKVIGKYIVETKNLADLTGQDLLNVIPFIPCAKKTLRQLNTDAIIAVMDQIKTLEIDKKCKTFIAEINPDLQDKTTIDNDKFKTNKKFLKNVTPQEVGEMNLDYEKLLTEGELKNFEVEDEASGRAVLDKVFEAKKPKDLTKNDIKNLGKSLLVTIQVNDIKQCDKTAFTEGFLDAVDEDPDITITIEGPSVQEILEMVVEVTGVVIDAIGDLFKQMPAKMLTDKQDESFGDMSGGTKRNVSCDKEQCSYLFGAFKEENGSPDLENSNYTQEAVQNMGSIMTGMTVSDIKDLPPTDCSTICSLITLEMNDHQLTSLVDKLKYIFGLMDIEGEVAGSVTTEDIEQCGTALTMFSVEDIERLPTDKKTVALKSIAQTNLTEVSQEKIDAFARLLQELLGKETGPLTLDDIEELGYLVCGLPAERYDDIEDNTVFDKLVLDNCPPLTQEKCKQFMKAVKRKYKKDELDSLDEEVILDIGECIVELDDQDLDEISDDVMEEIEEEIIESVEKNERKSKRKEKGMTKKEKEEKKTRQKKVKSKVVGAKIRNKQRRNTRSRRSVATTLTCEEMKLLGSGITALTTAQITAMSDNDFLDCASMFGKYSEWTNNQITALLDVATRSGTFNIPSQWTADHVESAGIITQGLTPSELSTLTDLTVDAMYAMGRHDGWSELQLQAGFSRWLELNGGLSWFITSTDLVALGHFACGASTDHIDQMNATEYSLAAKHIGELTSCLEHQLEFYAMLAKDVHAFGNVSTWSTSIVASVGNVIGGLSATELGSFSTDQLAMVVPETIALIPSSAFVGFTPVQLASFSLAQSNAVTQNQQAGLSRDQLLALAEAGATLYSAAHCLMIPVIMTFIPLVMAYIFHL